MILVPIGLRLLVCKWNKVCTGLTQGIRYLYLQIQFRYMASDEEYLFFRFKEAFTT